VHVSAIATSHLAEHKTGIYVSAKVKNDKLIKERGISFTEIIETIAVNGILLNIDHPNTTKYINQKLLVVQYQNYAYSVPYVIDEKSKTIFLKTIYPNRKFKNLIKKDVKNEKLV